MGIWQTAGTMLTLAPHRAAMAATKSAIARQLDYSVISWQRLQPRIDQSSNLVVPMPLKATEI